jgi:phosphatidylethanolamine/phosphatidyl-N-methylethanolamine N-methyltransferase
LATNQDFDDRRGDDDADAPRPRSSEISERLKFLAAMFRSPRRVSSVTPTSRQTAVEMARPIDCRSGLPVLELGPGTGPITRAILDRGIAPENLYAIEYSADLCRHLEKAFPGVNIIHGDAFDLDATLAGTGVLLFDCVISGIPLLSFGPGRSNGLLAGALDRVPPGRPMVQITYSAKAPLQPSDPRVRMRRSARIVRNLPPASVWLYSRPD